MTTLYDPDCPVARTLEIIGERWTILMLRDLILEGPRKFRASARIPFQPGSRRWKTAGSSSGGFMSSIHRELSMFSPKRVATCDPSFGL
jgi:hypothetical protein